MTTENQAPEGGLAQAAEALVQAVQRDWPHTTTHRATVLAASGRVCTALATQPQAETCGSGAGCLHKDALIDHLREQLAAKQAPAEEAWQLIGASSPEEYAEFKRWVADSKPPIQPQPRYRLRKPGESLENYRIAMGWDKQVAAGDPAAIVKDIDTFRPVRLEFGVTMHRDVRPNESGWLRRQDVLDAISHVPVQHQEAK